MKINKICEEKPAQAKMSFVVIITMCTIILAIGLIGCILMLFRLRKQRKQRPFTMTTLVGNNPNMSMDQNQGQVMNQSGQPSYLTGQMTSGGQVMMSNQGQNTMMLSAQQMNNLSNQPTSNQLLMMQQQQRAAHPQFRMAPIGSSQVKI